MRQEAVKGKGERSIWQMDTIEWRRASLKQSVTVCWSLFNRWKTCKRRKRDRMHLLPRSLRWVMASWPKWWRPGDGLGQSAPDAVAIDRTSAKLRRMQPLHPLTSYRVTTQWLKKSDNLHLPATFFTRHSLRSFSMGPLLKRPLKCVCVWLVGQSQLKRNWDTTVSDDVVVAAFVSQHPKQSCQ